MESSPIKVPPVIMLDIAFNTIFYILPQLKKYDFNIGQWGDPFKDLSDLLNTIDERELPLLIGMDDVIDQAIKYRFQGKKILLKAKLEATRVHPALFNNNIGPVAPMKSPTGLAFALKYAYGEKA